MDDARHEAGRRLQKAREAKGLSKREAARLARLWLRRQNPKATFSEALWRNLERGERNAAPGVVVPANPLVRNLYAAAHVAGLDVAILLEAYGREPAGEESGSPVDGGTGDPISYLRQWLEGFDALSADDQARAVDLVLRRNYGGGDDDDDGPAAENRKAG